MDGDEFNLKPVNESKGIQYLFTRPQDIAAAAKILISSDTQNLGSAKLQEIPLIASVDDTTLENIIPTEEGCKTLIGDELMCKRKLKCLFFLKLELETSCK